MDAEKPKGPPFDLFGTMRLFFEKFLMCPTFEFVDILQQNGCKKNERVPLSDFLAL